jgi:diaminopimelate epimerase
VAAYLYADSPREAVVIETGAGLKSCSLVSVNGAKYEIEIAMGHPEVGDKLVVRGASGEVAGVPVSMGNPHYVVFVDDFAQDWQLLGAEIGRSSTFKYGVNVEFVKITDSSNIDVRFFERGVGETQSSGTGSCASAAAAISCGRAESPVRVHTPGGVQVVRWVEQVFLRGAACLVARGEFYR